MANIKFFYNNLIKTYTPTETSQHENFPVENLQHRDFNKAWHSQHGAGSGWGNFKIVAGVNRAINFEETLGVELTATVTAGEYNADELCAEIKTQLEVAGASTYTVTYSDSTNKFTLASDRAGGGGTFKLLWATGTNTATYVGRTIGFQVIVDDNDAASHEADDVRIHSEERAIVDLTAATDIYGIIIRGLNFSAAAIVDAIFSADAWTTIAEHPDFTVQDDIMILQYDSGTKKSYQYAGIRIKDPEKDPSTEDLFSKVGVLFIGPQFQPVTNYLQGSDLEDIDPSIVMESEAGQESSLQEDQYEIGTYVFRVDGATEVANFKAMRDAVGTSKALFVCEDPTSDATARATTKYIRFTSWKWIPLKQSVNRWQLVLGYKEQR